MTLPKNAFILTCMACSSLGRRVHIEPLMPSSSADAKQLQDPLKVLASMLQASAPEAAFANLAGPSPRLVPSQQGRLGVANIATRVPVMHHIDGQSHEPELGIEQQAADCLKQGCPADTVEELLIALKEDEKSSTEFAETIIELEKLLLEPKANKNAIEKLVASLASSYTLPSEVMGAFGEALGKRRGSVKMSADVDVGYEKLAVKCLEEGCPVDTVEELVATLKADEREPTAELTEIITELERLLPSANKNEMSKWVEAAFGILFKPMGEPYAGPPSKPAAPPPPRTDLKTPIKESQIYKVYKPKYAKYISEESRLKLKELGVTPKWAVEKSPTDVELEQKASKCLEEGCQVDTVKELVAALKADDREPTAELTQIITELEKLLVKPTENKNEIDKWVNTAFEILVRPFGEQKEPPYGPEGTGYNEISPYKGYRAFTKKANSV